MKKISVFTSILVLILFVEFNAQQNNSMFASPWEWNTFLGSAGYDNGYSSVVDDAGSIYIVGESQAAWGSPVNDFNGTQVVFVAKISDGFLEWNTFIGEGFNYAGGIDIDAGGNIYVTGQSWQSWGTPMNDFAGAQDAFVAKLSNNGVLIWNTFLGSTGSDFGHGIALWSEDEIYITGESDLTWGSPIREFTPGFNLSPDAFVAKLNGTGQLVWNTFLGSDRTEVGKGIAVNGFGDPCITGRSQSSWGSPVNDYTGGDDVFVAELDSGGNLAWNTFFGSEFSDYGNNVTFDRFSNPYVIGFSTDGWGTPVGDYFAGTFVVKLNTLGGLEWNTFLGSSSSGADIVTGLFNTEIDVYVTGSSAGEWGNPVYPFVGGDYDGFVAKLTTGGELVWNSFFGSAGNDFGMGIDYRSGKLIVCGTSGQTWGTPTNDFAGSADAFEVIINPSDWATGVEEEATPKEFHLSQNYPNPFSKGASGNAITTINYTIPVGDEYIRPLRLKVYDILGKEVATLVDKEQAPGSYSVQFSANGLTSGIYFYKLESGNYRDVKKMVILK